MRKGVIIFLTLLILAGAAFFIRLPSFDRLLYRQQFNQSEQLIATIETFALEEGHLPTEKEVTALKATLGLPADERCPCYQLEENGHYIVWFGYQSTGSSMVYDSSTAEWAPRH